MRFPARDLKRVAKDSTKLEESLQRVQRLVEIAEGHSSFFLQDPDELVPSDPDAVPEDSDELVPSKPDKE